MKKIGAATVRSNSDANKQRAFLHCRQPDTGKNLKYEALKEADAQADWHERRDSKQFSNFVQENKSDERN
jgi:hypothetical protein